MIAGTVKYTLKCLKCGKSYSEDRYVCSCENKCDALLKTVYEEKKLFIDDSYQGIWRYHQWLPIQKIDQRLIDHGSSFHTYKSSKLADHLGLQNLIICLNAYPQCHTGSFKDLEAEVTFQRVMGTFDAGKPLVMSSDGNNAISFVYYSNMIRYPIFLFATEDARIRRIWSFSKSNPYTRLFPIYGDYYDAINLANQFSRVEGYLSEGGYRNVARRDSVGTMVLDAAQFLGQIPDHYFQALGSGPGAIAAYEAAQRLIGDGRFGKKLPKIHGSQNYPYAPMVEAWVNHSRKIDERYQNEAAKQIIDQTMAHVLTNRFPAYSLTGGIYDVLTETKGEMYSVTNDEIEKAQNLFERLEGISIVPEAGVTIASLQQAIKKETISPQDTIVVNITGGGRKEIKRERIHIEPYKFVTKKLQISQKTLEEKIQHSKSLIKDAMQTYGDRVAVACSWGKDSMVLLHLARSINPDVLIFSVLTIHKPKETFEFLVKVVKQYHIKPKIFMVAESVPEILKKNNIDVTLLPIDEYRAQAEKIKRETENEIYYEDPDLCCKLLKVVPVRYAYTTLGLRAWFSGLRNTEGYTRKFVPEVEKINEQETKINPILTWTEEEIWRYIKTNKLPAHPWYKKKYNDGRRIRSLGCSPCTVPIFDHESERDGRWRKTLKKGGECGIHTRSASERI
jgi:cysteate synthase